MVINFIIIKIFFIKELNKKKKEFDDEKIQSSCCLIFQIISLYQLINTVNRLQFNFDIYISVKK